MTRPMTGQPATEEELTNATQRANKTMNDDVPEDIKNHPLTKDSLKDDDTDEKLEELREFKKNNEDLYEDNAKGGQQIAVNDDETEMVVTEGDDKQTFTREEWEERRDTRMRTWKRMARNGTMFVRVARWFNDTDVNKVKTGRGFYGHKVGETEKALKFEVAVESTHTAEAETVWVPKKAVRTHELK